MAVCTAVISACSSTGQTTADDTGQQPEPTTSYELDGEGFYHLLLGELALLNDDPETALYLFGQAQERYPTERRLLERIAPLAAQLGDLDLSLRYFRLWTENSPLDTNAWHGVWQLAFTAGDTSLAIDALEALLELDPAFGVYTPFELLTEWQPDAIDQFYEQIRSSDLPNDTNADLQLLLGYLSELQDNPEQAEQHWEQLADLMRGESDFFSYSQTLTELNVGSGARVLLTEGTGQFPEEPRLFIVKARSYLLEDDTAAALATLEEGLSHSPDDETLLRFAGEMAFEQKEPSAADYFERLLSTDKASAGHYYLGRLAEQDGDAETAFDHYQQVDSPDWVISAAQRVVHLLEASALPGYDPDAVFAEQRERFPEKVTQLADIQGRFWYDAQEYQQAFDTYSLGLREDPNDFVLLYMRALSAEPLDRLDDLEADLRMILAQDPDNTAALNALGYTLVDRTDRIDEAAPMIEQAYEQNPDSAAITDSLGWLRFKQGEYAEAVDLLETALDLQGWEVDDDEIVTHYVEALWKNDDTERALEVADRWLSLHANSPRLTDLLDRLGEEESFRE